MSELVYVHPNSSLKPRIFTNVINGATSEITNFTLVLEGVFDIEKPVTIIGDAIEVDEKLMEENRIYPIMYKGKQYYVIHINNTTEIFQLDD